MGSARMVVRGGTGFPARLADAPHAPERVFLEGPWDHEGLFVAIVGSRRATGDGRDFAHELAAHLARHGIAVISGLARGVDAAAHEGALDAGGRTGAILGTPLDRVFPAAHRSLQRRVSRSLGLLTEVAAGDPPTRGTFASRNRLLAALSDAVVLVQGRAGSGALLTARAAFAIGRPVGAVPWDPWEELGAAPLSLVKSGMAELIRDPKDALALLGLDTSFVPAGWVGDFEGPADAPPAIRPAAAARSAARVAPDAAAPLGSVEARLLEALRRRAESLERVALRARLTIAEAAAAFVTLELLGRAERLPGGAVRRARGA